MQKNDWLCFFPLIKSKERQTNFLPLMISHTWKHAQKLWISILKERNVFRPRAAKFCQNFARKRKLGFSLLCHTKNYDINAYVCTYRVKVERMILFVKIVHRYFQRKECFLALQFRSFDSGSVRIKGAKTLHLPVVHSKHTASRVHRLAFFTWLDAMVDSRVSG